MIMSTNSKTQSTFFASALLILFWACSGSPEGSNATATTDSTAVETPPPVQTSAAVSVWKTAVSVRQEPDPKGKWITSVSLGERFDYLGESQKVSADGKEREWAKVRLIDGKEGWIMQDFIVINGQPAAVLNDKTTVYRRPDILTKSDKSFNKFDVVAIETEDGDFLEVRGVEQGGTWFTSGWIKKENVTLKNIDVATSVYVQKAMALEDPEEQKEELNGILESSDFSQSIFIEDIRPMVAEPEEMIEEAMDMVEDQQEAAGDSIE